MSQNVRQTRKVNPTRKNKTKSIGVTSNWVKTHEDKDNPKTTKFCNDNSNEDAIQIIALGELDSRQGST